MLDGHGDDLYKYDRIKYNFSSNVYYKGASKAIKDHLKNSINLVSNYPSPNSQELLVTGAKFHKVSKNNLLFTNGATEAFYIIASAFRDTTAEIITPPFSEYESSCIASNISVKFINKLSDFAGSKLLFFSNPNNPMGSVANVSDIEVVAKKFPKSYIIVDEAYIDFTTKTVSAINLIKKYHNIIIVKSLTKNFAIPGVRLGYIISAKYTIDKLLPFKIVWSVNSFAISAAMFIFENYKSLLFDIDKLIIERDRFIEKLKRLNFLEVVDSCTTFFVCRLKKSTSSKLKLYLVSRGILIRDCRNFEGLTNRHIRISLQSSTANNALIEALELWNRTL